MVEERRRHPRAAFPTVRVRLAAADGYHDEFMQDLSAGGMLLRTERTLPVGSHVEAEILRPHAEVLRMDGLVVRLELADAPEVPGMAIQFVGVPDVVGVDLEKLVEPFTMAFRTPRAAEPADASLEVLNGEIEDLRSRLDSMRSGEVVAGRSSGDHEGRQPSARHLVSGTPSVVAGRNSDAPTARHETRESTVLLERELERERELRKTLEQERDTYKASASELRDEAQAAISLRTRVVELENRLLNAEELVRVAESVAEEALSRLERLGAAAVARKPLQETPAPDSEASERDASAADDDQPLEASDHSPEAEPEAAIADEGADESVDWPAPDEKSREVESEQDVMLAPEAPEVVEGFALEDEEAAPGDGDELSALADGVAAPASQSSDATEDHVDRVELARDEAALLVSGSEASSTVSDSSDEPAGDLLAQPEESSEEASGDDVSDTARLFDVDADSAPSAFDESDHDESDASEASAHPDDEAVSTELPTELTTESAAASASEPLPALDDEESLDLSTSDSDPGDDESREVSPDEPSPEEPAEPPSSDEEALASQELDEATDTSPGSQTVDAPDALEASEEIAAAASEPDESAAADPPEELAVADSLSSSDEEDELPTPTDDSPATERLGEEVAAESSEPVESLDGSLDGSAGSPDDITAEMELPLSATPKLDDEAEARLSEAAEVRLGENDAASTAPELVDTDGLFEAEGAKASVSSQDATLDPTDEQESADAELEGSGAHGVGYETVSQPVQTPETAEGRAEESFADLALELESTEPLSEWDEQPGTTVLEPPVATDSQAEDSSEETDPETSSGSQVSWDTWHAGVQAGSEDEAESSRADSESADSSDAFATRVLRTPAVPKPSEIGGDNGSSDASLLDHPSEADTMSFPPLDPSRLSDAMDELSTIETPVGGGSTANDTADEDFEVEFDIDPQDALADRGPGRLPRVGDQAPPESGDEAAQEASVTVTTEEEMNASLGPDSVRTRETFISRLESGSRLLTTDRFRRLEPVSRSDIQVSDWLQKHDDLPSIRKTAAGRMPDDELYRVLHLFFERGLVRLSA